MEADPYYYSWKHRRLSYIDRGIYVKHLKQWLDYFPFSQFHILCSEDLFSSERRNDTINDVFNFLGLMPYQVRDTSKHRSTKKDPGLTLSDEDRGRLTDFYRPYNEELFTLIGKRFPW